MNCPQLPPFTSFSTRFPQIHHYQISLSIIVCKIKLDLKLGPLRWLHWWPQKLLWVCYQVVAEYLPPIADFENLAWKVWRWQLQVDRGAAELKAGSCFQETLCRWQFSPMAFILFIFSWPQKSQLYCNLIIRTAFATISMFVNLMVILFIFVVGAMTERGSNKKPEHEVSSNKKIIFKQKCSGCCLWEAAKKHMWLVIRQRMTKCVFCVLCLFVFFSSLQFFSTGLCFMSFCVFFVKFTKVVR